MRGYKKIKKATAVLAVISLLIIGSVQVIGEEADSTIATSESCGKGFRYNIQGWVYVHIEGEPYERGYQYGYLASAEIIDMMERWSNFGHTEDFMKIFIIKRLPQNYYELSKTYWELCKYRGIKFFWDQYPEEYQQEIKGIADGIRAKGGTIHGNEVTYKDVFTLNVIEETRETYQNPFGLGRPFKTLFNYLKIFLKDTFSKQTSVEKEKTEGHCTIFIATGDATVDGGIVASHSLVFSKYMSQRTNMILDVTPTEGHRFAMTVFPGYIWSSQDFHENEQGIILMETCIWPPVGPWKTRGTISIGARVRKAIQYSDSLEDVKETLLKGNNGLYPCDWVMGDTKTGEIASLELGLYNHAWTKKDNGFLWSSSSASNSKDDKVRWELNSIFGLGILGRILNNKFRLWPSHQKLEELGNKYYGHIDIEVVKEIMSSEPIVNPTSDCKITDSSLIENLGMVVHLGRPDGFHWKPDEDQSEKYRGVKDMPGTGWLKLFLSKSQQTNLPEVKPSTKAQKESKIIWTYETENSGNRDFSLSAISGDTIFATSSASKVYAIDRNSGRLLWKNEVGEKTVAPSVSEDFVFTGADKGLFAVDKSTGVIKWEKRISGISSKPVVVNDLVVTGCSNGDIHALDIESGRTRWRHKLSDSVTISEAKGDIVCMSSGSSCTAFNLKNKEKIWQYDTEGPITKASVYDEDTVYFGSWDGNFYAVDHKTGNAKWTYQTGWGIDTKPYVTDDMVYFGSMDNNFYALNKNNGELKWYFTCKSAIHSSPTVYGEYVYFGSDDGRLYALDKLNGDLGWIFAPEFTVNEDVYNYITTPILSEPVVEDGIIYIDVKGTIYALDTQTVETSTEPELEQSESFNYNSFIIAIFAILLLTIISIVYKKRKRVKDK